jgi:hypothetical protein
MGKILVLLTGCFFAIYGLAFTLAPTEMSYFVTGGSTGTVSGLIDMRATYGGMSVAVGVLLVHLAKRSNSLPLALLATALVLLAMASGRIVGMVVDGEPNIMMYIYLGAELIVGTAALGLRKSIIEGRT